MFSSKQSDRTGLIITTIIFSLIAVGQLWRGFMNITVVAGGYVIPAWVSLIAGFVALLMAFWIGSVYKHVRAS